jgi:hypothetical protein
MMGQLMKKMDQFQGPYSMAAEWILLTGKNQDPFVFSDLEQCLQAHTEAIVKYLAGAYTRIYDRQQGN